MSVMEYHELCDYTDDDENRKEWIKDENGNRIVKRYIKPTREEHTRAHNLEKFFFNMINNGIYALRDAFSVIMDEHIFNIYNSNGNGCIE